MGGGVINSYITIHVNGNPVVDITDCVRHTRYNWGQLNGPGLSAPTTVNILHQGGFAAYARNFWARKPGGKWEKLYSKDNYSGEKTVPDGYVDFGFEFDIANPMEKYEQWPYSVPFWIASEHPGCSVIYHNRRLLVVLWVSSHRYYVDITVMGYDANGEYCNLYSYSNHELDYEEKSPNKAIPFPK